LPSAFNMEAAGQVPVGHENSNLKNKIGP